MTIRQYQRPLISFLFILLGWLILSSINGYLRRNGIWLDAPRHFPVSIFRGPRFNSDGLLYLSIFIGIVVYTLKKIDQFSPIKVWLAGLALIVFSNLGQGGWEAGFIDSVTKGEIQYYHDAIRIDSASQWLATFNDNQEHLLTHSRTHPPFAVLIHYWLLASSSGSSHLISIVFTLVSSLSIYLFWLVLKELGHAPQRCNLMTLLFAVIPAVSIYSAVSLDGVILTAASLFLLGLIKTQKAEHISWTGLIYMLAGILAFNLLSYGGLFLFAVLSVRVLHGLLVQKQVKTMYITIVLTVTTIAVLTILHTEVNYNHIQGFLTASALENPEGFHAIHNPIAYIASRVECISEIALFLSLSILALLCHRDLSNFSWKVADKNELQYLLSGVISLALMLIAGSFHTGETARAALYIYPFLLLAVTRTKEDTLKLIIVLAAIQTAIMQSAGSYFW